jgi:hypothetical protein
MLIMRRTIVERLLLGQFEEVPVDDALVLNIEHPEPPASARMIRDDFSILTCDSNFHFLLLLARSAAWPVAIDAIATSALQALSRARFAFRLNACRWPVGSSMVVGGVRQKNRATGTTKLWYQGDRAALLRLQT